MINKILEIIFQRRIKLACDIAGIYPIRSISDGITWFRLDVNLDFYIESHNPKFEIFINALDHNIFSLEVYNIYHLNEQQITW